jgi:hypothetical protein
MEKFVHIELTNGSENNRIFGLNADILEGLDGSLNTFVNSKGYVPAKGDTLYLLPGVNIPRMKLKDLTLNLGIRVVRDPAKATVVFSGKSSVGKLTTSHWYYFADANTILENVRKMCNDNYYIDKLETAIASTGATKVCSNWSDMRNTLCNGDSDICDSQYIYGIETGYQETYDAIQGKPIYCESELITNINGDDSTIIDYDVYKQLKSMFQSSDDDNHILAMEIMANSHYEKSILYLLMLIADFNGIISNTHTKNHVNFKSMLGYFNWIPRQVCHQDSEDIIKIVDGKGLLTLDMIQVLYKEYASDIHRNIAYDEVFEIKEITIKQEYLDKLNLTSLNLINPEELEVTDPVDEIVVDEMVTDELIEAALTNINRNELKSELIAIEEELSQEQGTPGEESNNNQIEETNGDDFEWF